VLHPEIGVCCFRSIVPAAKAASKPMPPWAAPRRSARSVVSRWPSDAVEFPVLLGCAGRLPVASQACDRGRVPAPPTYLCRLQPCVPAESERHWVAIPEPRVAAGTTLAGCRLERRLGKGGMGEVYLRRVFLTDLGLAKSVGEESGMTLSGSIVAAVVVVLALIGARVLHGRGGAAEGARKGTDGTAGTDTTERPAGAAVTRTAPAQSGAGASAPGLTAVAPAASAAGAAHIR
jgi:hypothetical protein